MKAAPIPGFFDFVFRLRAGFARWRRTGRPIRGASLAVCWCGALGFAGITQAADPNLGVPAYAIFEGERIGANLPITDLSVDPLGRLVAISGSKLLIFDGSSWTSYWPRTDDAAAPPELYSLIAGPDGRLYGSSAAGVGAIELEGDQRYSLRPIAPEGAAELSAELRESFVSGDFVYFYGAEQAARFDTRSRTLETDVLLRQAKSRFIPHGEVIAEYWTQDKIYLHQPDGRAEMVDTGRGDLARPETRQMTSWRGDLILGHDRGLSRYRDGAVVPWRCEVDTLASSYIADLQPVSDDYLAVAVGAQGVYLLDRDGNIAQSIDRRLDHRFGKAANLIATGDGVAWASFDTAIVRIQFLRPLSNYAALLENASRFPHSFLDGERLHLALDGKLLRAEYYLGGGLRGFDDLLPEWPLPVETAIATDLGILFSDFETVQLRRPDGSVEKVSDRPQVAAIALLGGSSDWAVAAGRSASHLLRREGDRWIDAHQSVPAAGRPYFAISGESGDAWLENGTALVTRVFTEEGQLRATAFGPEAGFKNAWVNAWTYRGRPMFSSGAVSSLLSWDARRATLARPSDPLLDHLADFPEVSRPALDSEGNLFVPTAAQSHAVLRPSPSGEIAVDTEALAALRHEALVKMHPGAEGRVWIIGDSDIFHYDPRFARPAPRLQAPLIQNVEVTSAGAALFDGWNAQSSRRLTLPFRSNSLRIRILNATINDGRTVSHQYRMVNQSGSWTTIESPGLLSLSNLREGRYALEIRPTFDGRTFGPSAHLDLDILPPWFRAPWAYFGYALLGAAALAALFLLGRNRSERRNRKLETLVSERTQSLDAANAKLSELYQRAREADEAKGIFLASVSHEMRTPLNAIIGPAQLLQQMSASVEERKLIKMIQGAGRQMLALVDDVLAFTSTGNFLRPVLAEPFDLRELTSELTEAAELIASPKDLTVALDYPDTTPNQWVGDAKLIQQVVGNLINNAVKFTEKGGSVIVSVAALREDGGREVGGVKVIVRDTGIGIPEEARKRVFEAFQQVETGLTRRYDGMGIGLAICKHLVGRMEGTIDFESALGKGSAFWFTLPMRPAVASFSPTSAEEEERPLRFGAKRVLLVDDNEANRFFATRILRSLDLEVVSAVDGEDALVQARASRFDLILMDIRMPVLNGIDASRAIRKEASPNQQTPIVAVSAFLSDGILEQCSQAGINLCLSKPFTCEELNEVVESIFPQAG